MSLELSVHYFDAECGSPNRVVARLIIGTPTEASDQQPADVDSRCTVRLFTSPEGEVHMFRDFDDFPDEGMLFANAIDIDFQDGILDRMLFDLEYDSEPPWSHLSAIVDRLRNEAAHADRATGRVCLNQPNVVAVRQHIEAVTSVLFNPAQREELTSSQSELHVLTAKIDESLTDEQPSPAEKPSATKETRRIDEAAHLDEASNPDNGSSNYRIPALN